MKRKQAPITGINRQIVLAACIIIVMAAMGTVLWMRSHAASAFMVTEPETGQAVSPAHTMGASSASAGGAVAFGAPASGSKLAADILDLTNWKLTLPIDGKGGVSNGTTACSPIEITQPALASYSIDPWFHPTATGDGVVFRANIEGCTTSNSGYPRSELREMTNSGTANASWSTTSGTHTMELTEAVMHLPVVKPQTTFAQIHDASDDIFEAEATGNSDGTATLNINHNGTVWGSVLDTSYVLGTKFTLKVVASGGYIDIWYNGVQKVHQVNSSSGDYFKAGNYTQSNISKGHDSPGAYGETVIYALTVAHS